MTPETNASRPSLAGKNSRAMLQGKYNAGRVDVLLIALFTLVNIIAAAFATEDGTYFLFCAMIPYYFVLLGLILSGSMSQDFYNELQEEIGMETPVFGKSILYTMLVIAIIIIVVYLLMWFLSKNNRVGFLVAALVLFGIDTLFTLFMLNSAAILDLAIHALAIWGIARGVVAGYKLKKLPIEEERVPFELTLDNTPASETATADSLEGAVGSETHAASDSAVNTAASQSSESAEGPDSSVASDSPDNSDSPDSTDSTQNSDT